jgi:8-oxo-dGTP pyrophosphatase MutT (NUDIX family)
MLAVIKRLRDGLTYYVIPGGSVEDGETPADAARREGVEELGVPIALGPLRICIDHLTRGVIQRQWYFEATVETDAIAVTGPELGYAAERGTYTATWLPIASLHDDDVQPAAVAELVARHHTGWPDDVIETES